jgi:hypothetical protein
MQNNTTAAAAVGITAAAAAMFQSLAKIANNFHSGRLTDAENDTADNLRRHAVGRICDAAGQNLSFDTIVRIYGFPSSRTAGRVMRKAAAFEISGCGDFFAYLNATLKIAAFRGAVDCGQLSPAELQARDFFTADRSNTAEINGLAPLLIEVYGSENYRLALNVRGNLGPFYKNDTFFCPLFGQYCSDGQKTRVFTKDGALFAAALPHGGGRQIQAAGGAGNAFEIYISDRALPTLRAGYYFDFFRAVIFEDEFSEFEIAVIEENGTYAHISQGFIWADGLLHARPEGFVCSPSDAVSGYHSNSRLTNTPVRFSRNAPYLVGFEVEKEDERVKCSITARDFAAALPNFRKERDGSLDDRAGFEFITPPLELSPRNIRAYLDARPVAVAHINAAFSTRCGGHIHLSRRGYSGRQLFEMIAGHLPLLHALFPARADGSNSRYCVAKSAADLLRDREKYQSINILSDRIEFRIFGAVRGMENLIWRAGLVLKLFKHDAPTPAVGFEKLPRLFSHLRKVYTTPAEMEMLIKRVEKYARKFEAYRPNYGADFASGIITDAARFKIYRPASARKLTTDAAGRTFVKTA